MVVVSGNDVGSAGEVTRIVEASGVSVLVARPSRGQNRVVAATNLMFASLPVLRQGAELARSLGASLTFVHNVPQDPSIPSGRRGDRERAWRALDDTRVDRSSNLLSWAVEDLDVEAESRVVEHYDTAEAILEMARSRQAELIRGRPVGRPADGTDRPRARKRRPIMSATPLLEQYSMDRLREVAAPVFQFLAQAESFDAARSLLTNYVSQRQFDVGCLADGRSGEPPNYVVRDCARALRGMLTVRSEQKSGFSVAAALWDLARRQPRPDLQAGFLADMTETIGGLLGRGHGVLGPSNAKPGVSGRIAALWRSDALDSLWALADAQMQRIPDGLAPETVEARTRRRERIQAALGCGDSEFEDWQWQIAHLARDADALEQFAPIGPAARKAITEASKGRLPFGVTPYYASLLDESLDTGRDRALRAQVLPTLVYVDAMREGRGDAYARDFMREHDTSPVDLVTRRYPAIAILKPFNACPQICVYCQRNWEIDQAMAEGALASAEKIDEAIAFIANHPAIREVLVTGGDPLGLRDEELLPILRKLADIPHVDVLRLGTRTPVTLPMRITPDLARALGDLREPGRREVCVVTHVEHAYEVTRDFVKAVDRLKREGISVYNQLVYTFFVSRRFEAAKLRMLLKRCGVDPYYTFLPKGKGETADYRVPIARLLQEQKEEARLLPGTRRTDEAVYNVPGLGKNYLRAFQHRDLIAVLPSGERVYEFHPWEKGVGPFTSYVGTDVPILEYLQRLEEIGEDPGEYQSIWTYF